MSDDKSILEIYTALLKAHGAQGWWPVCDRGKLKPTYKRRTRLSAQQKLVYKRYHVLTEYLIRSLKVNMSLRVFEQYGVVHLYHFLTEFYAIVVMEIVTSNTCKIEASKNQRKVIVTNY